MPSHFPRRYDSPRRMDELIKLVQAYRATDDLEQRLQIATNLVGRVAPALREYVFTHSPPEMVEDISVETIGIIANTLLRFRGTTDAQLWGWCYEVVRNRVRERLRRRETDPLARTDPDTLWTSLEFAARGQPMSAGERLDLEYALDLLRKSKPPCYDYLWTHYVLGWDLAEVARSFGLSYDAARMQVRRCLELAQALLGENR